MALWLLLPGLVVLFAVVVLFSYVFAAVPLPPDVQPTVVLDQAGREVAQLTSTSSQKDVKLAELPEHVRNAVLAAEDAGFYEHPGVSLPGIFRAALKNLMAREVAQGGSTISQQYIKVATQQNDRTPLRKIREAALAVKLEQQFSKDQILEMYVNSVYFGRGAYGIQAAAEAYFGKPATELTLPEAAQLAGIIPAPSALDPIKNPDGAKQRYDYVLDRLAANQWVTPEEAGRLKAGPPQVLEPRQVEFRTAPFFLDLVQRELAQKLGEDMVYRGLRVTTTLDLGIQQMAEKHFNEAMANAQDDEATGAMVSVDPATGGVRALVNGRPGEEINLAADARRQPGSTFKPFTLATWVEEGKSPESTFQGPAEMTFPEADNGQPYTVHNYGNQGFGRITLREASWKSVNTVYAQVMEEVTPEAVVDMAGRAGISSDLGANLSLTLGTSEVTPLELAGAFNTFAAGGIRREPYTVLRVERGTDVLYQARPGEDRAFSEQVAWTVTEVLKGVVEGGTGRAADIGRPAAGKTGTTQDSADAWFAGYTPHMTTVVWYGRRDGNEGLPSRPTGGGWPATLWGDFMGEALAGVPPDDFPEPQGDLDVVGPTVEPSETETEETEAPECPEGQIPVTAEGGEGETDPLQQVCAPSPSPSPTATPTPTQTASPTSSPSPTATATPTQTSSPLPTETSPPTQEPDPDLTEDATQTSGADTQGEASSEPSPSPSG